jgi:hypothetical protein
MSRSIALLAGVVFVVIAAVVVARLGAQPVGPVVPGPNVGPTTPELPRGIVVIVTASAPDAETRLRDVTVRTLGGRPFFAGAPLERQLTDNAPQILIPVDTVLQLTVSGAAP